MTLRTLNLTQNNNLPKRCPSKGSFRFNQFRYKKTRKANYDFGQNNTWKQILPSGDVVRSLVKMR